MPERLPVGLIQGVTVHRVVLVEFLGQHTVSFHFTHIGLGWLKSRQEIGGGLGWAVGVTAAVLIGQLATEGLPPIPPVESHDWLIWVVVPVAGFVASLAVLPGVSRWPVW